MKLIEAWYASRLPYKEVVYRSLAEEKGRMWWGAFGRNRVGKEGQSDLELVKRALRIAKFDKSIVAVFNVIVSVIPLTTLLSGTSAFGLISAVSLSLGVSFGFTLLYAIQTLSSFVGAESMSLLSTLPLEKNDFSLITLFSFIRSVDYMVLGATIGQVFMVGYLTASPVATLLMLLASLMNAMFAASIALWFSRLFNTNLSRGGRSKTNTALRFLFILMWGSLLLGVGFLFSVPWLIVPYLEWMLSNLNQISSLLVSLVYPFSFGIVIANFVNPAANFFTALIAGGALVGYVLLAGVTGRWTLITIKRISEGSETNAARTKAQDFSIKNRNPVVGYAVKDLRTASRNPATAFFFALPVLESAIVSLLIANYAVLRASTVLLTCTMGGVFALLMPLALLNSEGKGLEYTKTLPLKGSRIIAAKTLISTAVYVPVPLTLLLLAFIKPLTWPVTILIPFVITVAMASASIFELKLFLHSAQMGRIRALILDLEKLVVGILTIIVPEATYAVVYFMSFSHVPAILAMFGTVAGELAIGVYLLKHS